MQIQLPQIWADVRRRVVSLAHPLMLATLLIAPVVLPASAQDAKVVPQSKAQITLSFAPVVRKAVPAVVNVYAQRVQRMPAQHPLFSDPFFQQFFGQRPRTQRSLGSGVIIDKAGLVVTNNHVIEGMTEVKVALADRREFEAKVVLRDKRTDLAVLRIVGGKKDFPFIPFANSDALEVGDIVLAIGNPFGVGQTVTQGIVSALARTQTGITDYAFFIQTDAAINPGNSGGALIDMHGRLAGINTAIYSRTGGSVGIGFAIPVNMVRFVVRAAREGTRVRRPWIGATMQTMTKEIADSLGLDRPTGALVSDIYSKSAAEKAGLRRGDVIVAIDGKNVEDQQAFGYHLGTRELGGTAKLTVLRNGKRVQLDVVLQAAPETPPREPVTMRGRNPFSGATVVNYSPAVAEELSVKGKIREGVVIANVSDNSAAAQLGLKKGDVILAVNGTRIRRTSDMRKASQARPYYWRLTISRDGQTINTVVPG